MPVKLRAARREDVAVLAELNAQLIEDQRSKNPMTVPELAKRMASWLSTEYEAVLFEIGEDVVGYALFCPRDGGIYLRQFFISRDRRREQLGSEALALLHREVWPAEVHISVDVLVHNQRALAFWRAVGFIDHAINLQKRGAG